MTIQFNGTGLSLQPTEVLWVEQDSLGFAGNGAGIYPAIRECQLVFNLPHQQYFYELWNYFQMFTTGSVTATLPEWAAPVFRYKNYSGAIVHQPQMGGAYFAEEYLQEVRVSVFVRT